MATAFSYSGTGLESAIQSGSGGIGTGSSITLEVDSVPSDVSQGDTVKVALGPASDWAAGSGETAYGDIGGAGANGGTNLTLTDRGQEGTSAASWSEGDPVRVGVEGRDDAGPERPFVQSSLSIPGKRSQAYADFDAQNQNADGYEIASGQTLTVQTGSASIENKALKLDASTNNTFVTLPRPHIAGVIRARVIPDISGGSFPFIIGAWVDTSNHILLGDSGSINGYGIIEVKGGTSTNLVTTNTSESSRGPAEYVVGFTSKFLSFQGLPNENQIDVNKNGNFDNSTFDASSDPFGFACTSGVARVASFTMFGIA